MLIIHKRNISFIKYIVLFLHSSADYAYTQGTNPVIIAPADVIAANFVWL